jgi:hypothetical protein
MRPWRHLDGWDQVLERLQHASFPEGTGWGINNFGLSLQSATAFVRVSVTESPAKIFVAKAEGTGLISLGNWERQEDGSWLSEQWGTANREELVDKMEQICRSALSFSGR